MEPETFTPTGAGGNPRAFICCEGIGKHEPGCTNALAAQLAAEQRRLDWLMDKTDGVAEVYAMTGCRHTALSRIAIDLILVIKAVGDGKRRVAMNLLNDLFSRLNGRDTSE